MGTFCFLRSQPFPLFYDVDCAKPFHASDKVFSHVWIDRYLCQLDNMSQERASTAALRPSVFGKVANKYFGDMKEQTQAQMDGIQQDLHKERKQLFVLMGVMLVFCAAT